MSFIGNMISHDISDLYYRYEVIPIIAKYEGTQYTNDPKDPGGPTKYGWTLSTYRKLIDPKATVFTIQNLTKDKSMGYYKKYFWDRYGASKLSNRKLSTSLLLSQINLGPYRPNRLLQNMDNHYCHDGLKEDGILGDKSIKAINQCRYLWPGFPYILYYFYSNNPKIAPVWKWAHRGLRRRILHGVSHD